MVFKSMMASSVQGLGAANAGMPQISGNSIIGIPKRDHDIVEHGIVEHCTDSARDCQLAAGLSQTSRRKPIIVETPPFFC
jgi:hypothetical protein